MSDTNTDTDVWFALYTCGCVYAVENGKRAKSFCPGHYAMPIDVGHRTERWIKREQRYRNNEYRRDRHRPW